jgi:hypothetical protein
MFSTTSDQAPCGLGIVVRRQRVSVASGFTSTLVTSLLPGADKGGADTDRPVAASWPEIYRDRQSAPEREHAGRIRAF